MKVVPTASLAVALLVVLSLTGSAVASSGLGYAQYSVTVTGASGTRSVTVNESVSSTTDAGLDVFFIGIASAHSNFTYSRSVNSSLILFPYVPAVANQSFSYDSNGTSLSGSIRATGSSRVDFQGSNYTLTDYSATAQVSSGHGRDTLSVELEAFPSGLLYSLQGDLNSTSTVSVVLSSTSLDLNGPSVSSALQVASIGVSGAAIAGVVALSFGVRAKRRSRPSEETKPDYWVD